MRNDGRVLACVDQSKFAEYVADYAAWAARRIVAPLELLHVIERHPEIGSGEDHSGAIGINAEENLLSELALRDEARSRAARERGRVFLNALRGRTLSAGAVSVDVRQRHGELQETLAEQEPGVRLFVLGRRGASARTTHRDLGRNVETLVRALHKPILTVTEGFREPRRVMIAFDGGIITRRGVEMVAASPLFLGLPIHLLMSGRDRHDSARQLQWAKDKLEGAGFECTATRMSGDAERIIGEVVQERSIDLLVMGAYSHSFLRRLATGSKTTDVLRSAAVPTLLLR